jgi:hypothetical protein
MREIAALRGFGELSPHLEPNGLAPLKDKAFWQELQEYGEAHRVVRDQAFTAFVERGAYPVAQVRSGQRIPVEVKYRRRIDHRDTLGLRSFIEKAHYNAPFGVLVTMADGPVTEDPRIVSLPLSTLLLLR